MVWKSKAVSPLGDSLFWLVESHPKRCNSSVCAQQKDRNGVLSLYQRYTALLLTDTTASSA